MEVGLKQCAEGVDGTPTLTNKPALFTHKAITALFACPSVSSSRYEAQGGIEVISPANSPALREEKNEGPFPSEKSSQPPTGETSKPGN